MAAANGLGEVRGIVNAPRGHPDGPLRFIPNIAAAPAEVRSRFRLMVAGSSGLLPEFSPHVGVCGQPTAWVEHARRRFQLLDLGQQCFGKKNSWVAFTNFFLQKASGGPRGSRGCFC